MRQKSLFQGMLWVVVLVMVTLLTVAGERYRLGAAAMAQSDGTGMVGGVISDCDGDGRPCPGCPECPEPDLPDEDDCDASTFRNDPCRDCLDGQVVNLDVVVDDCSACSEGQLVARSENQIDWTVAHESTTSIFCPGDQAYAVVTISGNCCGTKQYTGPTTRKVALDTSTPGIYAKATAIIEFCPGITKEVALPAYTVAGIKKLVAEEVEYEGNRVYIRHTDDLILRAMRTPDPEKGAFPNYDSGASHLTWSVALKPQDSQLSLDQYRGSATARFKPDYPGKYLVRVSCGSRTSSLWIYAISIELIPAEQLPADFEGHCLKPSNAYGEAYETTYMFVNRADADNNEIPDYANNATPDGNILKQIVLVICPTDLPWDKVQLKFAYSGHSEAPTFEGRPIEHQGRATSFMDYTHDRKGIVRLWNLRHPEAPRKQGAFDQHEKYIVPGREYQAASDLGISGIHRMYVEGINKDESTLRADIRITNSSYRDKSNALNMEVIEAYLWLNNSNNSAQIRPGVPSVNFEMIPEDFVIKDQGEGFVWWATERRGDNTWRHQITDYAPLVIQKALNGDEKMLYHLESTGTELEIIPGRSDSANRREYLQNAAIAKQQDPSRRPNIIHVTPHKPVPLDRVDSSRAEFIFRCLGATPGSEAGQLRLWADDPRTKKRVMVDSYRLTVRPIEHFWTLVSARNSPSTYYYRDTEDGRDYRAQWAGRAEPVASHPGRMDPEKTACVVWLHGFNVTAHDAKKNYNEIYRRLFWIGFRGNFVGFSWRGDRFADPRLAFKLNVTGAFQTALTLHHYLRDIQGKPGSQSVDIVAHSLGNLVMWDALRIEAQNWNSQPIARNVVSIQAAIWREAFESRGELNYPQGSGLYTSAAVSNSISYSENDQQLHSWRFWLNQPGRRSIANAIKGLAHHSYVHDDTALATWMRMGDYLRCGLVAYRQWHYYRNRVPKYYRAPEGNGSLAYYKPALLHHRPPPKVRNTTPLPQVNLGLRTVPRVIGREQIFYSSTDLNIPAGCVKTDFPDAINYNARTAQDGTRRPWRSKMHSDYLEVDKTIWFPRMWTWWDEFLGDKVRESASAIPIGQE